ncbi:unannotated protein [freshwater metagenome]|uniref:Unannotated protein n=1 Tax=freshwater metagenome TaxID=449393 RepID=A0A6J6PNG5_9ZZZZ
MRLLHLVEQHDGVRAAAHRLGQLAALVVADVARRGPDQARDGVLLAVLAHVDAHDRALVVEEEVGQRLGQLGLAGAGRAQEEERPGRAVRVGDAGPGAAYGVADRGHRLALPDQSLADHVLHREQLGALAGEHAARGDAGPGRHDLGDLLGSDLVADERVHGRPDPGLGVRVAQRPLQLGDLAVEDFAGLVELALAHQPVGEHPDGVEAATQLALPLERGLLLLPARLEGAQRLLLVGEVGAQPHQPLLGGGVALLLERELLHLESLDLPTELVDLLGGGLDLHPQPGRCLVDQVDRLVGQVATGDVAVGERGGRDQRGVGDPDAVVGLVLLLDAAQDLDGVLDRRLADQHLLEAAFEGGVLLDALAVLVERRGADHVQLAARQHRLEHVAGVHGGVAAGTGADDGVQLVDEGDDLPAGVLDLLEHGLEALLELAAVLRTGDHRRQVEAEHPTALQRVGHVAGDHPLGETLDDGGLTDAGLADQDGVVLRAPTEHLDDPPDLGIAADHGVEAALLGGGGQVDGVLLQRLIRRLGSLARDPAVAAHGGQALTQTRLGETGVGEQLLRRALGARDRDEQVLGRDVVVLERGGEVERPGEHPGQGGRALRLLDGRAAGARQRVEHGRGSCGQIGRIDAGLGDQAAGDAVVLAQQSDQQVDGLGGAVARGRRGHLGSLDRLAAAGGELVGPERAHRQGSSFGCRRVGGELQCARPLTQRTRS